MNDTTKTTEYRTSVFAFSLAILLAMAIWALSPALIGKREPWDASNFFYLGAMSAAGMVVGLLYPWRFVSAFLGFALGQGAAGLITMPPGPLDPLALLGVLFLALGTLANSMPGVVVGSVLRWLAKWIDRRWFGNKRFSEYTVVALLLGCIVVPATGWILQQRTMMAPAVSAMSKPSELQTVYEAAIARGAWDVLERLAMNPAVTPEMARHLYREAVARERRLPTHGYPVLVALARQKNTPPDVLVHLAAAGESTIRREVASNPRTPPATLVSLAKDDSDLVRAALTWNPAFPDEHLPQLARDMEPTVQSQAIQAMRRRGIRDPNMQMK